jgi:glycosyltransferase involved in cell wall biosynthesis
MVGPDPDGMGGISRVVKIWQSSGFFYQFDVNYISTTSDLITNKSRYLIKKICEFLSAVRRCDFVYIHTSSFRSFYRKSFFLIISFIFWKKIVLHIHPSHFLSFVTESKVLRRAYILLILRRINIFVVLTEEMKSNILRLFPGRKVYVLRNPINLHEMVIQKRIERSENRLLYLGWFIKEKGVFELVDAFEILKHKGLDLHLDFYGTKETEELRAYVVRKNLTKEITVHGWIGDREKLEVLYHSTILILPTHSEGIPNVILEAMATKTPIVSTAVGGLKEVLADRFNAVVTAPKNPADLSAKIEVCLEDKKLRTRIADNAFMEVKAKYEANVVKKEFENIIMENAGT